VAKQANEFEKSELNPNLPAMRGLPMIGLMALVAAAATVWAQDEPAMKGPGELILPQDPPKSVPRVLDRATTESTSIVVSLGRQRVYLYVDGEMAIDAPASTGKRRGQTPTGEFVVSHETHLHGDFVDRDGNAVRHGVSTRIDAAPSGTTFRAVPVQYYLRLNDEGLSLHAGRLPGYPASDTAVRLPADIAPLIFQRVKQGTPVRIEE
jgi:lipoprotein-anchoring transpeptidase ErfK/SrfK